MAANNSVPLSILSASNNDGTPSHETTRRSANFHPSIWGDYFLHYSSQPKEVDAQEWEEHRELKEKVKKMFLEEYPKSSSSSSSSSSQKLLEMIDKIQRLGLGYQFEEEIQVILQHMFEAHKVNNEEDDDENNDLHVVSLRFRLLRQQGHNISCNVFEKFMGSDGKFKESLVNDVHAMLSLYEASHLRVHGENILDEALAFTTFNLESISQNMKNDNPLRSQVIEALKRPICKRLTRIEAQRYISIYQLDETHNVLLLRFAKLDFNLLQREHRRELGDLTRWWKELDFARKLPFARDRLVEGYFWTLAMYFEPQYSFARKFFLKVIAMSSIVDDIYDVYGTPNELLLFTHALQRWDINAANELPEYMKVCYIALLDVYAEMEKELDERGELYRINYAISEMKKLGETYMKEDKWFRERYVAKFEEYMDLGTETCGVRLLATTSFVGMKQDFVTKEVFDWVSKGKGPLIVVAAAIICRLMDDIAGHEFEQQRGHLASAVECYMKQYGKSKEETYKVLQEQVNNAWKDINQECLNSPFPMPILLRVVNFARVMDLLYDDGDSCTHSSTKLKHLITSLLVNPIL